jgi:hypothetical protein
MLSLGVKLTKDGGHIKTNGELHLEIIAGEIMESGKAITHYLRVGNIPYDHLNRLRGHIISVGAIREYRHMESVKRMNGSVYMQGWKTWYTRLLKFRMDPKNDDKDFTVPR